MTEQKQKKMGVVKNSIIIVIAIILAMGVAAAMGTGTEFKQYAKDYVYGKGQKVEQKSYTLNDVVNEGYAFENNEFTLVSDSNRLILSDINDYVKSLTIYFNAPTATSMDLFVYYSTDAMNFSEDNRLSYVIDANKDSITIYPSRTASALALKLFSTGEENISFSVNCIKINEGQSPFDFKDIFRIAGECFGQKIWFARLGITIPVFLFIAFHFIFNIRKMYEFIFDKRWIIGGLVLLYMVVNQYHGDSIAMFDYTIQPGEGSEFVQPLFGRERAIRSDEWLVDTGNCLSSLKLDNPYGKYNTITRGTKTINNLAWSVGDIINPFCLMNKIIYIVFGAEYGFAFNKNFPIILAFLVEIELFLILTKRNKLLSVCAGSMVVFSSWFMWWSMPSVIWTSAAAVVCVYYFSESQNWKQKILFAIGTGLSTANFVIILYPAWQVPVGFVTLGILVWLIHEQWDKIKGWRKEEWITVGITLVACIGLIGACLYGRREYMEAIMQTEYPGGRQESGGFAIYKAFNYIVGVLFPYRDYDNPCEAGALISFFPLPLLMGAYVWLRQKKKDWLMSAMLIVSAFLTVYCTFGFPEFLSKVTLMSYSTATRAVDILGYAQVILFITLFSDQSEKEKCPFKWGLVLAICGGCFAALMAEHYSKGYMKWSLLVVVCVFVIWVMAVSISKVSKKIREHVMVGIIVFCLLSGATVRPIAKGLDAIYSKPVAGAIEEIVDNDKEGKWIAYGGIVLPQYAISCGAPTINSVNTYPNMELWRTLDPEGTYNEVYNRYAHVNMNFIDGDTWMELMQTDCMTVHLSYKDIQKTGVKYILALSPLSVNNEYVRFDEVYSDLGAYIYVVNYY